MTMHFYYDEMVTFRDPADSWKVRKQDIANFLTDESNGVGILERIFLLNRLPELICLETSILGDFITLYPMYCRFVPSDELAKYLISTKPQK